MRNRIWWVLAGGSRGQGMVEYGLIIAFVALLAILGLVFFGSTLGNLFSNVGNSVGY